MVVKKHIICRLWVRNAPLVLVEEMMDTLKAARIATSENTLTVRKSRAELCKKNLKYIEVLENGLQHAHG